MTNDEALAHLFTAIREVQAVYNSKPSELTDNQRRSLFVAHAGIERVAKEIQEQSQDLL